MIGGASPVTRDHASTSAGGTVGQYRNRRDAEKSGRNLTFKKLDAIQRLSSPDITNKRLVLRAKTLFVSVGQRKIFWGITGRSYRSRLHPSVYLSSGDIAETALSVRG